MPVVKVEEIPEGLSPALVVQTPHGTHYFTEGEAFVSEDAAEFFEKNKSPLKHSSGRKARAEVHEAGDPYDRSEMAENPPKGQEAALNPHEREGRKLTEIEKAHEGIPNRAAGQIRGTDNNESVAAAKEEHKSGPRARASRSNPRTAK